MTYQDTLNQDNHNMMKHLLARRIENREVFGSNSTQDKYNIMYHSHVSRKYQLENTASESTLTIPIDVITVEFAG